MKLEPRDARFYEPWIVALLKSGRPDDAAAALSRALNTGYGAAKAAEQYNEAGVLLAQGGVFAKAEPLFREAVRLNPLSEPCRRNLVMALAGAGRADEAREEIKLARKYVVSPALDRIADSIGVQPAKR